MKTPLTTEQAKTTQRMYKVYCIPKEHSVRKNENIYGIIAQSYPADSKVIIIAENLPIEKAEAIKENLQRTEKN